MGPHWSLRSGCPHLKCAEDHSLHRANAVERLGEVSLSSFGTPAGPEPPSALRAGDRGVDVVEFASRQMDHECGVPAGSGAPPRRGDPDRHHGGDDREPEERGDRALAGGAPRRLAERV
jgi:hypothetical protein